MTSCKHSDIYTLDHVDDNLLDNLLGVVLHADTHLDIIPVIVQLPNQKRYLVFATNTHIFLIPISDGVILHRLNWAKPNLTTN